MLYRYASTKKEKQMTTAKQTAFNHAQELLEDANTRMLKAEKLIAELVIWTSPVGDTIIAPKQEIHAIIKDESWR